jgi:hypothetical protein
VAVFDFVGMDAAVVVNVILFVKAFGEITSLKYDPFVFAAAIDILILFGVVVVSVAVVSVDVVPLRTVCFLDILDFVGKNDVVIVLVVSDSFTCISDPFLVTFSNAGVGRDDFGVLAFAATDIALEDTEAGADIAFFVVTFREGRIELSVDEDSNFNDCESKYVSIVESVSCEGVG